MRRDIVTYDSNFAENEKTDLFKKQIDAMKPKSEKCFDDLTFKYNELLKIEKVKRKRDAGTRAILALARRIM